MSGKRLVVSNPRQLINLKTQKLINSLPSSTRQLNKHHRGHRVSRRSKLKFPHQVRDDGLMTVGCAVDILPAAHKNQDSFPVHSPLSTFNSPLSKLSTLNPPLSTNLLSSSTCQLTHKLTTSKTYNSKLLIVFRTPSAARTGIFSTPSACFILALLTT